LLSGDVAKEPHPIDLGAALMKQVKTAANRGVQDYQHWLYATFWKDNRAAGGYLTLVLKITHHPAA